MKKKIFEIILISIGLLGLLLVMSGADRDDYYQLFQGEEVLAFYDYAEYKFVWGCLMSAFGIFLMFGALVVYLFSIGQLGRFFFHKLKE